MPGTLRALVVEDSTADAELCLRELQRTGFELQYQRVDTAEAFAAALASGTWDVVLSDHTMPRFDALSALRLLREQTADIPFIVVTGSLNEETAVECMQHGADDYVLKENLARLAPAVERALRVYEERRERRRLEAQLRHAQRLETVGTLAGGIAHDFNNLLTAIFGHLDMARAALPPGSPVLEHLDATERAARRAVGITRALLTFSHRTPAEKRRVGVSEILRETNKLVRRLLPANVIQEWEIPDAALTVEGDPTQIQQVLLNLIVNARDAMPGGGTLRVSAVEESGDLRPRSKPADSHVALTVADTGVGMIPAVQARIFEPFFTTKPRGQGTGLGLAVVHAIVADHGGWIDVESEIGAGTRFSVFLPRAADLPDAPSERTATLPAAPAPGLRVLVIEDDPLVQSVIGTALRDAGYAITLARDGVEGLRQFHTAASPIHAVIADLELPGISGLECLKRIGAQDPQVRRILITGRADVRDALAEETAGCTVLVKPFQMQALLAAVGALLGQNDVVPP